MTSEIRVNKINNRAGLGTVEYTPTGIIVSGIVTAYEFDGNFDTTPGIVITGIGTAQSLDVDDFVDVGSNIKLGNAGVVTATTFSTANVDINTDKIVVGTGVTIEANQVATGQATFTGIVTASAFKLSDGSNVGGIESDAQSNTIGGTGTGSVLDSDTYSNTLFGYYSGTVLNSGDGNTAVGTYSLRLGTSATSNSLFGYGAGRAIVSGNQNTLIGYEAGTSVTGNHHVAVGYQALKSTTSGENNTALGYKAGTSNQSGEFNVFIGYLCGFQNNSGDNNNFMGYNAGFGNNSGHKNVAIGHQSLYSNSSNDYNTMLGHRAGYNVTGSNNTVLGGDAGYGNLTSGSNNIIVGYDAESSSATVSNEITFGNSNINHVRIPGIGVSFSEGGAVIAGVVTATSFSGDGSNLSNLPASAPVGGASTNTVFFENDTAVAVNYQVTSNKNAMSAGPIAINAGIAVTVPSGSSWTIV